MSGRSPRWFTGIKPSGFDVVLAGAMDATYAYVTIDGVKYSATQTLIVPAGSTITVTVGTNKNGQARNVSITLDGTTVASWAGTDNLLHYEYTVAAASTLTFAKSSMGPSTYYFTCAITTS